MFPVFWDNFLVQFVCFPWKNENSTKIKKIFFFEKKCIYFFLKFLFFDIFSHFSGGEKKMKIFVFFSKVKNTQCLWTKILTWKVDQLWWKIFWSFLKTLSTTETFFFFLRHHVASGATFEKKMLFFFFKISSNFGISDVDFWPKFRPIGRKFHQKYFFPPNTYQKNFE